MKVQNILTLGSVLGLALFAGQASADVGTVAHNKNVQHVNNAKWLDLMSTPGNQISKICLLRRGNAAVMFSAETAWKGKGTGWLNTRIFVRGVGGGPFGTPTIGYLNNDVSADNYAIDTAKGVSFDWEGHAFHAGFKVPKTGFYRVYVSAEPKNNTAVGTADFWVDDTSLICLD